MLLVEFVVLIKSLYIILFTSHAEALSLRGRMSVLEIVFVGQC